MAFDRRTGTFIHVFTMVIVTALLRVDFIMAHSKRPKLDMFAIHCEHGRQHRTEVILTRDKSWFIQMSTWSTKHDHVVAIIDFIGRPAAQMDKHSG